MNNVCEKRLQELRAYMKENGVYAFVFLTGDSHGSEYVAPYFKTREYFSGFTGSAGTLYVGPDEAYLWTDGRYFIQAERQLRGSGIGLMKMLEPGVPTLFGFLSDHIPEGKVLGIDGRCMTAKEGERYEALALEHGFVLRTDLDPAAFIMTDRPALPDSPLTIHEAKYVGETPKERIARLRDKIAAAQGASYLDSKLDSIMWLLSLRGNDIDYNPVALSHIIVDERDVHLFVDESKVTEPVAQYLDLYGITRHPYDALRSFLSEYTFRGDMLCDYGCVSDYYKRAAQDAAGKAGFAVRPFDSPLVSMKSVKNRTEMECLRECYKRDSAKVCSFIRWIQKRVREDSPITESGAAEYLDSLRAEIEDFRGLSFGTISAYGPNAAMMHYQAEPGVSDAVLKPEGMLLVDSGGQYLSGTTDVTRTTALGRVTDAMRRHYTLTAVSNLQLMGAVFMEGCRGSQLDILARMPMWKEGLDYKCGTGHGIGYFLNVHEAPPSIRWRTAPGAIEPALEPGMIVSDEPGVYLEGEYGIRIETILEVVDHRRTASDHFLAFRPLTLVPLDRKLLDPSLMTEETKALLDDYHARVYDEIAPLLPDEDREWLRRETLPLSDPAQ